MTPSELKAEILERFPDNHFFDRDTMRFFGDTMQNYGVCRARVRTDWRGDEYAPENGDIVECWKLYRKRPVKHGVQSPAYFDCETFRQVHCARQEVSA